MVQYFRNIIIIGLFYLYLNFILSVLYIFT